MQRKGAYRVLPGFAVRSHRIGFCAGDAGDGVGGWGGGGACLGTVDWSTRPHQWGVAETASLIVRAALIEFFLAFVDSPTSSVLSLLERIATRRLPFASSPSLFSVI